MAGKPSSEPLSRTYTIQEVAKLWNVSDQTVRRLTKKGELPSFKVGRQRRITEDDLHAFIRTHRV